MRTSGGPKQAINQTNEAGQTLAHLVGLYGPTSLWEELPMLGIDLNIVDNTDHTALDYAIANKTIKIPPSDRVITMENYQEKLDNVKLKLSTMPRDKLQQVLTQFRTTLHGLDAIGRVHPNRITQLRLDRQMLADVMKWSVEHLESNPSSAPSVSASSAIQSTASTSSVPTLEQVRVRPHRPARY